MKFTAEMSALSNGVRFARTALASPGSRDFSSKLFRFEVAEESLSILAANTKIACLAKLPLLKRDARIQEPIVFGANGHKFAGLLDNVSSEIAVLTVDDQNVKVEVGSATVNFARCNPVNLARVHAELVREASGQGPLVSTSALADALYVTKSCSATFPVQPDRCHSELRNGQFVATDGSRVIVITCSHGFGSAALKVGHAEHTAVLNALAHVLGRDIRVIAGASQTYFSTPPNDFVIGFRTIERSFPPLEKQILALNARDEFSIDKDALLGSCRIVPFGLPDGEVRIDLALETLGPGKSGLEAILHVEGTNEIGRISREDSPCGRKAREPITLAVSFEHMLATLAVFVGDSVVDLKVTDVGLVILDRSPSREVVTVIPYRNTVSTATATAGMTAPAPAPADFGQRAGSEPPSDIDFEQVIE
jgi:hypothetical protein